MSFPRIVDSVSSYSTTGTISFTIPNVTSDQYLIVVIRCQASNSTTDYSNPGWDRLGPAFEPSSASSRVLGSYGKRATAEDSGTTATFTLGVSGRAVGSLIVLENVDIENPLSGQSNTYSGEVLNGNSLSRGVRSYSTDSSNTLQIFFSGNEVVAPNETFTDTSYPGLYEVVTSSTPGGTDTTRTALWVGSQEVISKTVPQTIYTWASVAGASAQSISIRGVESDTEDGMTVQVNGNTGFLYIKNDGTISAVTDIKKVHTGFRTVSEMLSNPGFTWAHRGGSANFPEMTLYSYTQSMLIGHGAMEISLARSSDGVWFGHHDETLNRVTGSTENLKPGDLTWSQLQQYTVKNGQQDKPFMSINEFIESYPSPGVVVLDIKYGIRNASHIDEFFEICHRFPENTVIVKYFYDSVNFAQRASAEGFDTWGYAYPANLSDDPQIMDRLSNWSILGMSTSATQQEWDAVLSLGKPVVGHIAQNLSDYNSGISKGAIGIQCANVVDIPPIKLIN